MRRGSFSDLCRTGNKHHRLSCLKAVLWGLVSSAGAARLAGDTGIREVTVSPSCWQEAVAVGTAAVALAGCPLGRNSDAIAGGGAQTLGGSTRLGLSPAPERCSLSLNSSIKEGWTFY